MPRTAPANTAAAPQDVWARHYATPAGFRHWPCEALVSAVGSRRFGSVLEVGCGNGANLWFLAEHAEEVLGVDDHLPALEAADAYMAERGKDNVETVRARAEALPCDDASVDAVVDVMVSQHALWSEHRAIYAEYRRVLRPGGWLFLYHLAEGTTVLGKGLLLDAFTRSELALFPDAGRICTPPYWALKEVLGTAGFSVGDARGVTRWYPGGRSAHYAAIQGEAT